MLTPGHTLTIADGPLIARILEALEYRYWSFDPDVQTVRFPTILPHPEKETSADLIVEIDSIGHGPEGDGSDWVIIGTLSRLGDFWSIKPGDSNNNPQVRIAYNSDDKDGVFELHVTS